MTTGTGELFQEKTKYFRGKLGGGSLSRQSQPETYKTYPSATKYPLSHPSSSPPAHDLWQIIAQRRSVRSFKNLPLRTSDLSRLLWASQGITQRTWGFEFRAAPSAGALYPIETYLVINDVDGIPPGVYHYAVVSHELEQLKDGEHRLEIAKAALDQDMAYSASVVFVWSAVFERSRWKYKQRAYRYVYLDAGHIAQNLALTAVALDLGSCQIAALYDDEANGLLGLDGKGESVIYMSVVGHPL